MRGMRAWVVRDARARLAPLLQQLVEDDDDDAGDKELQDNQDGVARAELTHVAVPKEAPRQSVRYEAWVRRARVRADGAESAAVERCQREREELTLRDVHSGGAAMGSLKPTQTRGGAEIAASGSARLKSVRLCIRVRSPPCA
eukprot:3341160-Pleurochrysis_carterae.AAC.1